MTHRKNYIFTRIKSTGLTRSKLLPLALLFMLPFIGINRCSAQQSQPGRKSLQPAATKRAAHTAQSAPPAPFVAVKHDAGFTLPEIVLQYDPANKTGLNWAELDKLNFPSQAAAVPMAFAVRHLREAVQRMTGKQLSVVSRNDLTRGIVLTTLDGAPAELKKDPEVIKALRNSGKDSYNANEAFFIRSEPQRVVIVANTCLLYTSPSPRDS